MTVFLLGATTMAAVCISLYFLRFWRDTRDSFHLLFAAAFLLLGIQRMLLAALRDGPNEASPAVYLLRFAAYVLIIVAVVGKNVGKR